MTPARIAHIATVDTTLRFLLLPQLLRVQEEGFDVTAISAPGPWVAEVERAGIRFIEWPHVTRAWDPRADARAFVSLVHLLRRERFDVVHTHTPKPGILGRIAARVARVPVVVNTVHGFYATPDDRWTKRLAVLTAEAIAARFSDLELFQSEEDLAWSRRRRVARAHAAFLGNGTNLERFAPNAVPAKRIAAVRAELGIPADSLVVGTVARLVAEKGYRELFSAARTVRDTMPDVLFLAVGADDGEELNRLSRDEIEAASRHVTFAGWRLDIPDLIAASDVFVLPSWREGLPRSAIEAAAMGKPLVLTNIRGSREVVRDGIEGLLVPPRDDTALAEALLHLLADPALRERMGHAALLRARERFDEDVVTDRVVEHYRRLLAPRERTSSISSSDARA